MSRKGHRPSQSPTGRPRFWGRHAVTAALSNPDRVVRRIWCTREAAEPLSLPASMPVEYMQAADLARLVPSDAPHQGLVIEVEPLDDIWLGDLLIQGKDSNRPLIILDQVTDPHNVGAIMRSAAAFDALGIITQDRHAPPESGSLAKSASGTLEIVPWVRVVNLARALDEISDAGYWRIGLTGATEQTLDSALSNGKIAIVLGAEGEGMRRNVMEHCDVLARLPISPQVESLNVSNAAAIALYAASVKRAV
ncbi:23S rRNA (guanosine(2251)-2'-O)-methyltransferase RlmB [Aquisediminimonas sediminicola]|uniref:23S rRNA (guanosine(2251)-2'-O)-methyltransferase RlmB n=1 Tax=Alteraquisediminimonas sediminicola TaxID=2676787 RepID=UPI001C8D352F|nr:23S rRNA (guanosine(2251)-2'-O)-methyltransferase RlmB [Aquisediminimonas sediminicola]